MYPRLYIFGNYFISTYSLIYVIAILVILVMVHFEVKRYGLPKGHFFAVAFWGMLFGVAGGKLFEAIFFSWDYFIENPWRFMSSGAGSMYYGVEVGTLTAVLGYLAIKRLPVIRPLDIAGFGFLLAHGIGRLGCFLGGCCYGRPTGSWIGIKFPLLDRPVHPTQLYEAGFNLLNFTFLFWFFRRKRFDGQVFCLYIMNYAVIRFLVEFFRGDPGRGYVFTGPSPWLSLSIPQLISLLSFAGALTALVILKKRQDAKGR